MPTAQPTRTVRVTLSRPDSLSVRRLNLTLEGDQPLPKTVEHEDQTWQVYNHENSWSTLMGRPTEQVS